MRSTHRRSPSRAARPKSTCSTGARGWNTREGRHPAQRRTTRSTASYGGLTELNYFLPEVVRWRNYLAGERRVASVPMDSLRRAVAFKNFRLHLNASLSEVLGAQRPGDRKVGAATHRFDYIIAGTGYRVEPALGAARVRAHSTTRLRCGATAPAAGRRRVRRRREPPVPGALIRVPGSRRRTGALA